MHGNTVILAGRLTADAEVRFGAKSQKPFCKFTLAVPRGQSREDESDFFDVTTFGKNAERLGSVGRRGALALVAGRLQLDRWQTPEGQKRSKVVVIADSVRLGQLPEGFAQDIERADTSGYGGGEPVPEYQVNDRELSTAARQQGVQVGPDEMPF